MDPTVEESYSRKRNWFGIVLDLGSKVVSFCRKLPEALRLISIVSFSFSRKLEMNWLTTKSTSRFTPMN
ncbi:hypothetical protein YC2023_077670 [Brassica napus]